MLHPIRTQGLLEAMFDILPYRGEGTAIVGHELTRDAVALDGLLHPGDGRVGGAVEPHMHIQDIPTVVIFDDEQIQLDAGHLDGSFEINVP